MNKKIGMMLLGLGLLIPAFAAEEAAVPAQADERPAVAQKQGEFKKAQQKHFAEMKATEKKMEKLVKEYGKLKGKKQEAKKAEITSEVEKIHEEQLKFKQDQLDKFSARLEEMKKSLEDEKSGQKEWVEKKTDELIKADGDLKVLFERKGPAGNGPKMDGKKGPFGPKFGKGMKGHKGGPRHEGFGPQGGPRGEHEGDFPPPAPDAEK